MLHLNIEFPRAAQLDTNCSHASRFIKKYGFKHPCVIMNAFCVTVKYSESINLSGNVVIFKIVFYHADWPLKVLSKVWGSSQIKDCILINMAHRRAYSLWDTLDVVAHLKYFSLHILSIPREWGWFKEYTIPCQKKTKKKQTWGRFHDHSQVLKVFSICE